MFNSDDATRVNIKGHNVNWPQSHDNPPYRILISGGLISRQKTH